MAGTETECVLATETESESELALREIAEHNTRIRQARVDYEVKNEKAKAAKKRLEALQEELERLITDSTTDLPLFASKAPVGPPVLPADAVTQTEDDQAEDTSWRVVAVAELGLAEGVVERLLEAAFPNLGAIADWTASGKLLTDIDGIGPAKAEQIEQALERFWAERRSQTASVEETPDGGAMQEQVGEEIASWRDVPLVRLLAENQHLAMLLDSDDIKTVGDIANILADGAILSEIDIADVESFDSGYRKLTEEEIKALQFALLRFREERGGDVLEELPLGWILSEPWDQKIYELRWKPGKGKEKPPYYLRSYSQIAACNYAEEYWPGKVKEVVEVDAIPTGARVENVPADTPSDRLLAASAELTAQREAS